MNNKQLWMIPAIASLAFLAYSVWVMVTDGPFGFVAEHTRNPWGVQIGIDLVASVAVGLCFAVVKARKAGVRPVPWVVLTVLTGSIGLLAFCARLLYVGPERASNRAAA